jgi:proteic killer suppression protein
VETPKKGKDESRERCGSGNGGARAIAATLLKLNLPPCSFRILFGGKLVVTLDVTHNFRYSLGVIVSYRDNRTRDFAAGKFVKAFSGFDRSARLKLDRLEAATSLGDLAALPGNRFEALLGDRNGQYSIRINDQWRLCFEWPARSRGPSNVEIVDYH